MERRTYDHLVIGAGSAGCVVAARLAQAGRRVALIEAGPLEEQNEDILNLGRWPELIGGPLDYDFAIEPQPRGNSAFRHPRGRVLGGTGSLNTCIAFIPADGDFQRWVAAGGVGWSAAEVAPHYERVLATLGLELADLDNPLSAAFVSAAEAAGLPRVDFAGAKMQPGVGPAPFNRQGDRRRSTAIAYLLPLSRWSGGAHLHILPERPVLRLLFEGDRAIGVATHAGEIFAEGAIILCAGAFHTPQLLLLSGIGPADELQALGIRPYLDLPGVGENLQDHPETTIGWQTKRPPPPNAIRVWEVVLFAALDEGLAPQLMMHMGPNLVDGYARQAGFPSAEWGFSVTPNVMRPQSRGRVSLRSADPAAAPKIDFRYFQDGGRDEAVLVDGLRLAREIAAQEPLREWIDRELFPGPKWQSDAALSRYARQVSASVYHPVGSCRLGLSVEEGAVVDPQLRLHGLANLYVADASVFPLHVGVNPNLTVAMIGERCAEWVLGGVP